MHIGSNGSYKYIQDLMALEANKIPMSPAMIPQIARVSTPLNIKRWEQYLKKHPDRNYAGYILQGLQHDFSIGL